jgi:hypothetical protein
MSEVLTSKLVMRGLDPRIHLFRKKVFRKKVFIPAGLPGLRLAEEASAPQAGRARQ